MSKALPFFVVMLVVCGCSSGPETAKVAPDKTVTVPLADNSSVVPAGDLSPQRLAEMADVPIYPGASFPNNATQKPKKDEAGKMRSYLIMSTPDSPDKVASFYQKSGHYEPMKTKDGTEIQGMSPKGNFVLIDLTQAGGQTIISVKSVQGS